MVWFLLILNTSPRFTSPLYLKQSEAFFSVIFITNPLSPLDIFLKKKKNATIFVRFFIFHGAKRRSFHQPIFFRMVCDLLPYRYLQDLADGSGPDLYIYHFPNAPKFHYCFSMYAGRDFHRPRLRSPCCICRVSPGRSSSCSLDNWD